MKVIFETNRLYLREFLPFDGANFFHLNNNLNVIKHTGDVSFKSLEEANQFILKYSDYKINGFGRWAVCLKNTNQFLGWCGLKYDEPKNEVDIGFRFFEKEWNKGYATESAIACLEYGFNVLNLSKIVGRAYKTNKASIKVLEKCNMSFIKEFMYDNESAVLYQKINDRS